MIEVLEGNSIVSEINNTGKKVSIKHYLNTYLFPVGRNENDQLLFPLYYRVIFNRQSVKIKSSIQKVFSAEEFVIEELSDENKKLMEREALTLTYVVSKIYTEVIDVQKRQQVDTEKPSKQEKQALEFDINQIFSDFDYSEYELPAIIDSALLSKMQEFAVSIGQESQLSTLISYSKRTNPYHLLQYLIPKDKRWKDMEKQLHKNVWFFNFYYNDFVSQQNKYQDLRASITDSLHGDFNSTFSQYCQDTAREDLQRLDQDVNHLIQYISSKKNI